MKKGLAVVMAVLFLAMGSVAFAYDFEAKNNVLGPPNAYHKQIKIEADSKFAMDLGPENLIDGDYNTRWVSAHFNTGPKPGEEYVSWIIVELPHAERVTALRFHTGLSGYGAGDPNMIIHSFALEYWDGNAWQEVVVIEGNTEKVAEAVFEPVEASRWRIRVINPSRYDWSVRAYELELFRAN